MLQSLPKNTGMAFVLVQHLDPTHESALSSLLSRTTSMEVSEARQRFRAGVAGNIEVINAQSSLLRARDADIDARFAAVTARIALARSVGSARTLH